MQTLIENLEAAKGPCRELDEAIANACFTRRDASEAGWSHSIYQQRGGKSVCPLFTSSTDAALTLVPEYFSVSIFIHEDGLENACHIESSCELWPGHAPTPALAICIAALRARSNEGGE